MKFVTLWFSKIDSVKSGLKLPLSKILGIPVARDTIIPQNNPYAQPGSAAFQNISSDLRSSPNSA